MFDIQSLSLGITEDSRSVSNMQLGGLLSSMISQANLAVATNCIPMLVSGSNLLNIYSEGEP